jgi:ubiquinone/menaquinone biosynthesis C-methylase UbiE
MPVAENQEMADASAEQRTFRDFEHRGWKELARGYHDNFASLTQQAVKPLLDAAAVRERARVFDACTGPGYAAAAAAARGARTVGMDFSPAMIAQASRSCPETEFLVGDAEELPLRSGSFDAVVTSFGLLHLGRPERFLLEAHRVLRPKGMVAFAVWAPPEEAVGFGIVLNAIQTHGNPAVPLPPGPPFFRFSDPAESKRALLRAGFEVPEVRRAPQVWKFSDPDGLFRAMLEGTVRTGGLLRAQTPVALAAIRVAVRQSVEKHRTSPTTDPGDITYDVPMPAVIASGLKP